MANWVIPDIHGCLKSFEEILNQAGPGKDDTVFLLGDYVDRGPDSKGVIDLIWKLRAQLDLQYIMGNHEDVLIRLKNERPSFMQRLFRSASPLEKDWRYFGGYATLNSFGIASVQNIPEEYWNWMEQLPYYIEMDRFYLVHAGFNFERKNFLEDKKAMLWIRKFTPDKHILNGKKIIHGHVPTELNKILMMADDADADRICLDNGCVYKNAPGLGNLLAMNLDTGKILIQKNIDF